MSALLDSGWSHGVAGRVRSSTRDMAAPATQMLPQGRSEPLLSSKRRKAKHHVDSMSFFAPVNERWSKQRGGRGVSSAATSRSEEVAIRSAIFLVGVVVAFIVTALHFFTDLISSHKLSLVCSIRNHPDLAPTLQIAFSWLVHLSFALFFSGLAFACTLAVPTSKGSGLPQLIAYLNGCKLKLFTSVRTMVAKFFGTMCALSGGFFCGPEGPIIHIGGCVGKLLLRGLYHIGRISPRCGPSGKRAFGAFAALRNDLDQRDFVAIGAGAGVSAAFMAPISGTLFVVEEAASHLSLSLLWRTFACAVIALWSSHWLIVRELLFFHPAETSDAGYSHDQAHLFHIKFDLGSGTACSIPDKLGLWVVLLAALGGGVGAAANYAILTLGELRKRLYGSQPSFARRARLGALELALLATLSSSASVLLPELVPCRSLTIGQLQYGHAAGGAAEPTACAKPFGKCGGIGWQGPTCCDIDYECFKQNVFYSQCLPTGRHTVIPLDEACMSSEIRTQIKWTDEVNGTCNAECMEGESTPGTCQAVRFPDPLGLAAVDPRMLISQLLVQNPHKPSSLTQAR